MDRVQTDLKERLSERGLDLSDRQAEQFELYYRELVEWNEKMNLTGITEREQVYVKHFYDSLTPAFFIDMTSFSSVADIGSGAGFPSIPLKIMFPHLQVSIVDSLNKRIVFLTHLTEVLGLTGVNCIHGRAEEVARTPQHRDRYDLVTARAVARLNVLNELCLPFVRKDGLFAAMKGSDPEAELTEAGKSMQELRAELAGVHAFALPVEEAARHIVVLRKTGPTPKKYPRKPGAPLKTPIM